MNEPRGSEDSENCRLTLDEATRRDVPEREGEGKPTKLVHQCDQKYWFLLRAISSGPTKSIDSRSQGLEDRMKSLPGSRKKRGFQRTHVLQFSVTLFAST